jgi:hypothetical protein
VISSLLMLYPNLLTSGIHPPFGCGAGFLARNALCLLRIDGLLTCGEVSSKSVPS